MPKITENILEETALGWLAEFGYSILHGPDLAPGMPEAERDDYRQVFLLERLRKSLTRINPDVPEVGIQEAIRKITVTESPDLIVNNRSFHRLLTDGVDVEVPANNEYGDPPCQGVAS